MHMLSVHGAGLVCLALGTAVFLNTLGNKFCFDDLSAIEQNKDLRATTPWTNLLWNDFWGTPMHIDGSHKSYRPLCVATFRLNYLLHELQPMGYHLVNVLLHGAVCYLYVQLCGVVFSGAVWPALIAGLLFAVHPIHTEAVAGVVGRAETLSSIFYLLTLFCYRRGCRDSTSSGLKWVCLSLVMCFCSVLSKEQGITAIAVCLTYDIFIARNLNLASGVRELSLLRRRVPLWVKHLILRAAMLVAFLFAVMILRVKIMKAELPIFTVHDNPAVALATPYRQLHWMYLVFMNCWLLLTPSFLCADWTMGTVPLINSTLDSRNLITMTTLLSIGVLSWYSITRVGQTAKTVVVSLSLMIFPFLPASNLFFPVGFVVAERVLYLPSMGFCMLVAIGLWYLIQHRNSATSKIAKISLISLLLLHSAKTLRRNGDWRSDRELFVSAIAINPHNGKLYNNLGHDYEGMGDHVTAEGLFRRAVRAQPDDIGAYINLGRALRALGHDQEAETVYKKAVDMMPKGRSFRVAPNYINVYYNLANLIRADSARTLEAYELYQKALSMKPDFVEAHMNKGDLLLRMNKSLDAKRSFEKALQYNPEYTDAHYNLATALVQLGERREAEVTYKRALAMDGRHIFSLLSLGTLLMEEGRLEEAKQLLEQAVELDPHNIRAAAQLAVVYLDLKEIDKSEAMLVRSLSIDPDYRSSLYNLAVIYNHKQLYTKALPLLKKLVSLYPDHINGRQLLGDCHMWLHQVEEAERVYREVLAQHPNHVSALHNLGVVRASEGDFDVAIQLFSKALELDPNHEPARKHIHEARLQQMNERQKEGSSKTTTNHSRTAGNGQSRQGHPHQHAPSHDRTAHKRTS